MRRTNHSATYESELDYKEKPIRVQIDIIDGEASVELKPSCPIAIPKSEDDFRFFARVYELIEQAKALHADDCNIAA